MLHFYLANVVMVLASVAAAAVAVGESRHRTIGRARLLAPGLLATLSVIVLLAFPDPGDLASPARWMLLFLTFLAGGVRGRFMQLLSDRALGLVRVPKGGDVLAVALAQLLFALIQFSLETTMAFESRIEPTIEFLMMATAGYLLGRSVVGWVRAGSLPHEDLHD